MNIDNLVLNYDFSKLDCFYADLRVEESESTQVGFKNGELEEYAPSQTLGAFLRVYNNGKWLYKFTTDLKHLDDHFAALVSQSKAYKGQCNDLFKTVPTRHEAKIIYPGGNPFSGHLEKKVSICKGYSFLKEKFPLMKELKIYLGDRYQKRLFKSSRGRSYSYDFADCGIFLIFRLKEDDALFMDAFRRWSQDLSDLSKLAEEAEEYIKESHRHLHAPLIKPGKYPVVLNSEVVGVFTHESFGHKSEADSMLGDPQALEEWKMGSKVASEKVSIVDDGGEITNSGYCPFDDEGLETKKTYLIKDGLLSGRLHSLETAYEFGEAPTGNARAIDFQYEPIVRMTNTYIEPGDESPEQIIGSLKDGLYVSDYRHGSGLSTFTIAPTRSYLIKDGKVSDPVKVSVISGDVFQTLMQIEKVGSDFCVYSSIFGGCGKDEQMPLRVADGGPTILVKEMQVG